MASEALHVKFLKLLMWVGHSCPTPFDFAFDFGTRRIVQLLPGAFRPRRYVPQARQDS
jgi:hypothetical protein